MIPHLLVLAQAALEIHPANVAGLKPTWTYRTAESTSPVPGGGRAPAFEPTPVYSAAIFLDIQMPGLDGFGVLDALAGRGGMEVVFVTAYSDHAVRAFEVQAFDYLMKPVAPERLAAVVGRLRARRRDYWRRILVEGARHAQLIPVEEIDWIEADRNYAVLHCGSREHLVRATMTAIAGRLDPDQFVRISRSALVNLSRIQELRPCGHGGPRVILKDGRELAWSRRYARALTGWRAG
ncbi:MAG: response regulator transcription factor [Acidobacteria bacterium]|nr:response regulator transcription factor [Acidobacteriota bacterium]